MQEHTESGSVVDWLTGLGAVVAGVALSFVLVPLTVYYLLVVRTAAAAGWPSVGLAGGIAMLPGFLMGGLGLWTAARG